MRRVRSRRSVGVMASLVAVAVALADAVPAWAQNQAEEAQARALIEYGPHSLTGRPGVTRNTLPGSGTTAKDRKSKSRTERAYASNEVIYLLPWTDHLARAVARGKGTTALIRAEVLTSGGAALRCAAIQCTNLDDKGRKLLVQGVESRALSAAHGNSL